MKILIENQQYAELSNILKKVRKELNEIDEQARIFAIKIEEEKFKNQFDEYPFKNEQLNFVCCYEGKIS